MLKPSRAEVAGLLAGVVLLMLSGCMWVQVCAQQPPPPAPPKNLRIVPMQTKTLAGLTVVLMNADVAKSHESDTQLVFEAVLTAKREGADIRLFAVSDRLVELHEIPESFGSLFNLPITARLAAAVNRVNILRPARILVVTGVAYPVGWTREGTKGYVWHAQQELVGRTVLKNFTPLFCAPADVIRCMIEAEGPDGAVPR